LFRFRNGAGVIIIIDFEEDFIVIFGGDLFQYLVDLFDYHCRIKLGDIHHLFCGALSRDL
jgi:hypothetical protein